MDVAKEGSGATAPWDSSAAADLNRNAEESLKRGGGVSDQVERMNR